MAKQCYTKYQQGGVGPLRRLGGPWANTKSGAPQNGLCEGGLGGMPLGNFEILHTLKCVLGAPEAFLCVCTHTPASCHLRLAVSDRKVYDVRGPS